MITNDRCDCTIEGEHALSKGYVVFCSLHAAAPEMLEVCEQLRQASNMDARAPAARKARIRDAMTLAVAVVTKINA